MFCGATILCVEFSSVQIIMVTRSIISLVLIVTIVTPSMNVMRDFLVSDCDHSNAFIECQAVFFGFDNNHGNAFIDCQAVFFGFDSNHSNAFTECQACFWF